MKEPVEYYVTEIFFGGVEGGGEGLRFVATVTTGGRVKFVPAVWIFPENNALSSKICIEVQDLHSTIVIFHWNFTHSV